MDQKSSLKTLLCQVGKLFLGLGVFLIFLELVVLRLFGYGAYIIYQPDKRLLWVPAPQQKGVTVAKHRRITINEDGFRYGIKIPPKPQNEIRIFTFGDSVTMGWGVDDEAHYSAVLERLLNSNPYQPVSFRVISAGVNAYPNSLVLERFKKVVEEDFQVDIGIIAYSINTTFEGLSELQGVEREQFLRKVALKGLVRRSALYNFFIEDLLRQFAYARLREYLVQGSWDSQKESSAVGIQRFKQKLQEINRFKDAHNVRVILLLLATEGQKSELHDYQKTMLEFADAAKLPLINMIDILRSQDHSTLFLDHAHPNERGHEIIAQELAKIVTKMSQHSPDVTTTRY